MKYLCLVYEERAKADALGEHASAAIADEDRDYLAELQMCGHYVASAKLQPAVMAALVRVHNGSMTVSDLSVETTDRLREFHVIDARDLNDAIRIAAKMPRARLGWVELRPIEACASR